MRLTAGFVILTLLSAVNLQAQNPETDSGAKPLQVTAPGTPPPIVAAGARNIAQTIVERKKKNGNAKTIWGTRAAKIYTFALAALVVPDKLDPKFYSGSYIARNETKRTDKQVGSSPGSNGSTSAAEKPGIPYLLGLAIEHGAINQNINGSTLNLSSSPYALIAAIEGDTSDTYNQYSGFTRLGVSASYDLQNQNDPLASVQRKQLSEWSAKLRLFGDRSPRSKEAFNAFKAQVLPALVEKVTASAAAHGPLLQKRSDEYDQFAVATNNDINDYLDNHFNSATAEDDITQKILDSVQHRIYDHVADLKLDTDDQDVLTKFFQDYRKGVADYVQAATAFENTLKKLNQKPTLTLGYYNERGSGTGSYSVGKLLFLNQPEGFMQITANVSGSAYHDPKRALNQSTFRDAAAALELLKPLGRSPFVSNSDDKSTINLSFAGNYERLQENRHVAGKKADIAVANWKLEIPVGQGVNLPISITYANASELIKEADVRGNFGITFDLDKLRSLVTAK